ncbi:MAG: helix-turn-helix domain-containing protein [Nigerium sp.]|nr:helix-turn-helix domain-containing protein [Nigerium sp.]
MTGMTPAYIRSLISAGELPAYKLGGGHTGRIRIKRGDLLAWIESKRIPAGTTGTRNHNTA